MDSTNILIKIEGSLPCSSVSLSVSLLSFHCTIYCGIRKVLRPPSAYLRRCLHPHRFPEDASMLLERIVDSGSSGTLPLLLATKCAYSVSIQRMFINCCSMLTSWHNRVARSPRTSHSVAFLLYSSCCTL